MELQANNHVEANIKPLPNSDDIDSGTEIHSDSGHSSDEERSSSSDLALTLDEPEPPVRRKKLEKLRKIETEFEGKSDATDRLERLRVQAEEKIEILGNVQIRNDEEVAFVDLSKLEEVSLKDVAVLNIQSESPFINTPKENDEYFIKIREGLHVGIDNTVALDAKPNWFDETKFKMGQQFAISHLFCTNFAEMLSLLILFAFKGSLEPLIFSGKSHSPFKAFQRYLSTLIRVKSWYEEDPWDPSSNARSNMSVVRGMHKNIQDRLENASKEELEQNCTLGDEDKVAIWCPLQNELLDDFRGSCPKPMPGSCPFAASDRTAWVNQADMSITQFGFVGLVVTYPEQFGLFHTTEEQLDAFVHLWRALGYLLGIKDEYNFCNGGLESVREKTKSIIQYAVKPNFRDINGDWEHMSRCMTEGISYYIPGVSFEVSLLYLCDVLNIHVPRLQRSITFSHRIMYYLTKFVLRIGFRFPAILNHYNSLLLKVIDKTQHWSNETLDKLRNKKYAYSEQDGKIKHK